MKVYREPKTLFRDETLSGATKTPEYRPQVSLLPIHIFHSLRFIATEVGVKALGTGLKETLEATQCVS